MTSATLTSRCCCCCCTPQDFGEHAREFISAELGLRFLKTMSDPEAIKAVFGGGQRGDRLLQLLQRVAWKVSGVGRQPGTAAIKQAATLQCSATHVIHVTLVMQPM